MTEQEPLVDEANARIAKLIADAERNVERAQQLTAAMELVEGRAENPEMGISVSVDSGGRLRSLELEEFATDAPAFELAEEIIALARQAHQDSSRQALDAAERLYGPDSPTTAEVRRAYLQYNPAPAENR